MTDKFGEMGRSLGDAAGFAIAADWRNPQEAIAVARKALEGQAAGIRAVMGDSGNLGSGKSPLKPA